MKTTITTSDSLRLKRRDRTVLTVATMSLMAMAAVLGAAAALMVPAGLPYDEPSHWSTVMYFAERWTLPVLGAPGVTYEGQQTPLYYIIAAALAGVTADSAFMAVRLFGVLGHALLVGLTAVILRETVRDGNLVVIAGAAFIALNPMLIVMSASVQNDTWALVWGLAAIAVVLLTRATNRTWVSGILVGILASLSILTKLSMAPLAIAIVAAYVIRRQIRASRCREWSCRCGHRVVVRSEPRPVRRSDRPVCSGTHGCSLHEHPDRSGLCGTDRTHVSDSSN